MAEVEKVAVRQEALEYLAKREEAEGFVNYAAWLRAGCPEQYPSAGADDWERPDAEIAMFAAAYVAGLVEAKGIMEAMARTHADLALESAECGEAESARRRESMEAMATKIAAAIQARIDEG